jgi:serine phosphatase RsbU (regulator of sigma subunit)
MSADAEADALAARIISSLLARSHLLEPGMVAGAITAAAGPLGVRAARIYLSDLQQRSLRLLPGDNSTPRDALAINSTTAGRAYRLIQTQQSGPASEGAGQRLWVPLVDGTERLGVMELEVSDVTPQRLDWYRALSSLAALMIVSKVSYSDTYAETRRTQEMALQAEMVWAFLPPRTFATERVLVAATLEPAYAVGGDAFDYSMLGDDHLHVSVFDAAGHDLAAGLMASVAMASCRSTRRSGGTLAEVALHADHAITAQFPGNRFVTAQLCHLDVGTGLFTWIPCGHPPPLLIRRNRAVKELARRQRLPLGMSEVEMIYRRRQHEAPAHSGIGDALLSAGAEEPADVPVHTERLEPGDRILLYTDGITEGRAADGSPFGVERLIDFIIRHSHDGTPAPEMIRRLHHAISDYQHGRLIDDATIVMVEWMPDDPLLRLTP